MTRQAAKKLADNHTIFSLILNLIEARAAQNIGLTALTFANDGDVATLSLVGQAPSYEAAYFQVETWRNSKPMIKSVDVSALTLQEESGIVDFSVKISIDPKTLGYGQMLARSAPERRNDSATVPAQTLPFDGMISSSTVKTSTTTK